MNHRSYSEQHAVYLVDLELPLTDMLMVLADHCDEGREEMFSPKDILMLALNFLYVEDNVKEAAFAMEIQVNAYCSYQNTLHPYARARINCAIFTFLTEMNRLFKFYRFYGEDSTLQYTFGGWHGEYTPVFIPYSHLHRWPQAVSAIVGGEPLDPHPSKVFRPAVSAEQVDSYLPF